MTWGLFLLMWGKGRGRISCTKDACKRGSCTKKGKKQSEGYGSHRCGEQALPLGLKGHAKDRRDLGKGCLQVWDQTLWKGCDSEPRWRGLVRYSRLGLASKKPPTGAPAKLVGQMYYWSPIHYGKEAAHWKRVSWCLLPYGNKKESIGIRRSTILL